MVRKRILVKDTRKTGPAVQDMDKIRQRAYLIWEQKGRPQNNDLDNWLQAERELKGKRF